MLFRRTAIAAVILVWNAGAELDAQLTLTAARDAMLRSISEQGMTDRRVLNAVAATPRHLFVPFARRKNAYYDMALPIGNGQTISPPFVVANMTRHIDPQPNDRVLEIGTGSGYQAAVLSPLVADVYSIEIVERLGKRAAATLNKLGYANVHTKIGDGFLGWPEHAPFDKVIVTCSPEKIPQPLIDQLRDGGRMVIPLGERFEQTLYLFTKKDGKLEQVALEPTFFVPMTGEAEARREVKADTGIPDLLNGGFESTAFDELPRSWYYVRGGKVTSDGSSPQGTRHLTFANSVSDRWVQALQAMGVDGKKVREIEVSMWVRSRDVRPPESNDEPFHGMLSFFDSNQAPAGRRRIGPWMGTSEWSHHKIRLKIPPHARLSVFALGLCGCTGEISFDDIRVTVVESATEVSSRR